MTFIPLFKKCLAKFRPIPEEAPVIRIVFVFKFFSYFN